MFVTLGVVGLLLLLGLGALVDRVLRRP
jgi:hypothetical protein